MQSLPSPADSPSLKSKDITAQPSSRKRQRSQSMQSDASSSSAKRSVSEGPTSDVLRSPHGDDMSTETITDIDSYMAEQGEADIPDTIQLSTHASNGITSTLAPPEKLSSVNKFREQPMKAGDTWYIVARQWFKRWEMACTGEVNKEGGVDENTLGPVDNSCLLDKDGNVTSSLVEGVDAEYVCKEIWDLFVSWYGEPAHILPRKVIPRGMAKTLGLELRPPRLKVLLLQRSDSILISGPPHPYVTASMADTIADLCSQLALPFGRYKASPSRIWSIDSSDFNGSLYPSSRLRQDDPKILIPSDETLEEALVEPDDAFVVEFMENGFFIDSEKILRKGTQSDVPPPLFSSDTDFFSQKFGSSSTLTGSKIASTSKIPGLFKSSAFGSLINNRNLPAPDPGTLGLGNMGNTCFMNSALQCLAHCRELTDYFLTGVYQEELNPENPLGMHGAIAEAFGALLHRIWSPNSTSYSYSPREFKQQLQRFAPQFSGYQQHDSQELVAFLLDGLHEDLNRVLKKPYVVKPDWEGGEDKELVDLAQKSWEGYMMRNDSVIVDLFQGQYQSTLVCPECQKVSITFDPFMYLTLPLPVQKKWRHDIYYIPWDLEKSHVRVPVEISRDASFKDLRHLLGRWMDAKPDNLLTLEVFSNKFYKSLDDGLLCGEMGDSDTIVCFELPCHAQQSRTYKKQPDDPFIMPVYLTDNAPPRYSYRSGPSLFGYPFIVVIDRNQATDVEAMYDAVVEQLQRWTSNVRDLYTWEADDPSDNSPIQIVTGTHLPMDAPITEIKENGDVVTIEDVPTEESDIVDEKSMVIQEADADMLMDTTADVIPIKKGTKKNVFQLRLQVNHKEYGTSSGYGASGHRYESWDIRQDDAEAEPVLLRAGDAFFCEFDENMKPYYFGDQVGRWEQPRWTQWTQFIHPEYTEARRISAEKRNKGMTLDDCLTEFTKEEQLGEDDLWYCPRCKKHQQATKKFDLWRAPDVLVVHLKRFSNSRTLRDKIDTLVDFPVDGLDITDIVGERQVAKRLIAAGVDVEEMGLRNLEEPLIYDLFGVDEHLGGLGGGHYRAYASNHITNQWYHFDDSYVTKARATDAVNANAYLLFYKRRTDKPLGGKSHDKIQSARSKEPSTSTTTSPDHIVIATQLPTPPDETNHSSYLNTGTSRLNALVPVATSHSKDGWPTPDSNTRSSPASSPTPLEDKGLPSFEASKFDDIVQTSLDPLLIASQRFDFPDPSSQASPTSSIEAEPDLERLDDISDWDHPQELFDNSQSSTTYRSFSFGPVPSPDSSSSEGHSFADANAQKENKDMDTEDISPHNNRATEGLLDSHSTAFSSSEWEPVSSSDCSISDPFADANAQKGSKYTDAPEIPTLDSKAVDSDM